MKMGLVRSHNFTTVYFKKKMIGCDQLRRTTKKELVRICRLHGWRQYSSLSKPDLVRFVFCHINRFHVMARKIQRGYRQNKHRFRLYRPVNDTDFLTLEAINCDFIFFLRNHVTKQVFQFNPRNLMQFILTTGNFINPFTREDIADNDLLRLHQWYMSLHEEGGAALTYRVGSVEHTLTRQTSILGIRRTINIDRREETQRGQTTMRLDSQCHETMNNIVELVLFITTDQDIAAQIMVAIFSFWLPTYLEVCYSLMLLQTDLARNNLRQLIGQLSDISRNTAYSIVNRNIAESVLTVCRANYYELFGTV